MNKIDIYKIKELKPILEESNYVDIKEIKGSVSLRKFISNTISYRPSWLIFLYKIRKIISNILGLKHHENTKELLKISPQDISFKKGDNVAFFTVNKGLEDKFLICEVDDKHLKAFLIFIIEKLDSANKFYVITTVKYKHWTGYLYFWMILPFHHLVVKKMMKSGVKNSN